MLNFWQQLKKSSTFPKDKKSTVELETGSINGAAGGNFWKVLDKPFFCLAPMEEVTDVAFREMFARYSGLRIKDKGLKMNPFVMYTEFINVDGLTHPEGRKKLGIDLKFTENQRPIIAQLWGRSPLKFTEAAKIICDMGFDGIDINMGCPQDKETGIGACAALIKEPHLAVEIIKAAKSGAGGLPVSVKTRLGYNANDIGNWLRQLLAAEPAAVAIHGRTKKDKSKVPADWSAIGEAVKVRDKIQGTRDKDKTFIIGNGDIGSRAEGLRRVAETGVDGVMVGRGAFGNPWFFAQLYKNLNEGTPRSFSEGGSDSINLPNVKERLSVMLEHAQLFDELLGKDKPFVIMRKHFKAYASGFDGAHELRAKLMETKNLDETKIVVQKYLKDIN